MKTVNLEAIFIKHQTKWENNNKPYTEESSPMEFYINAMREACNQSIDLAAEVQAVQYTEAGFTSTGKKINDSILNLKSQII